MTVRNDYKLIKTIFVNASEKSDQCCGDTTDKDMVVSHEKSLSQRIKDEGGKSKCAIINISINPADT